jgi:hypothetical protein
MYGYHFRDEPPILGLLLLEPKLREDPPIYDELRDGLLKEDELREGEE